MHEESPSSSPAFQVSSVKQPPPQPLSLSGNPERGHPLRQFTAVVERDTATGLFVGYVPGFPGAHTQAATLDELQANLREVIQLLLEDGEPALEAEFIGVQTVQVQ
jgi:predicted RNase H-like HicB family nuclease